MIFPGPVWKRRAILLGSAAVLALLRLPALAQDAAPVAEPVADEPPEVVVVTARRTELIGVAVTSSEGIILREELLQLPTLRAAQLLEAVPGLVVTIHSGEGKANQYLLRGVNLDHGTDLGDLCRRHAGQHAHARAWPRLHRSELLHPRVGLRHHVHEGALFRAGRRFRVGGRRAHGLCQRDTGSGLRHDRNVELPASVHGGNPRSLQRPSARRTRTRPL